MVNKETINCSKRIPTLVEKKGPNWRLEDIVTEVSKHLGIQLEPKEIARIPRYSNNDRTVFVADVGEVIIIILYDNGEFNICKI